MRGVWACSPEAVSVPPPSGREDVRGGKPQGLPGLTFHFPLKFLGSKERGSCRLAWAEGQREVGGRMGHTESPPRTGSGPPPALPLAPLPRKLACVGLKHFSRAWPVKYQEMSR